MKGTRILCFLTLFLCRALAQSGPVNLPEGTSLPFSLTSRAGSSSSAIVLTGVSSTTGLEIERALDLPGPWERVIVLPRSGRLTNELRFEREFFRFPPNPPRSSNLLLSASLARADSSYSITFPLIPAWNVIVQTQALSGAAWIDSGSAATNSPVELPFLPEAERLRVLATPPIDRSAFVPILLTGQSNAELPDYDTPERETNVIHLTASFAFVHPSKFRPQFGQYSFQYSFSVTAASELAARRSTQYLIVPVARGGTSLSNWLPSPNRFDRSTLFGEANFRRVLATSRPFEAIWYFGHESSTVPPDVDNYLALWRRVISEHQKEIGPAPVIFAQLGKSANPTWHAGNYRVQEIQRLSEAGEVNGTDGHHMVVTFDLPLGDDIHLSGAANHELGHRFALAMREHVYREPVNGTGPRLRSVGYFHGNRRYVELRFSRPVNDPVDAYDHQFTVRNAAGEQIAIARVTRDDASVILEVAEPSESPIFVSYGEKSAPKPGEFLANVIRDSDGLPAPAFGPLVVR